MAEADREKTAFVCHRGQFQYNRVSFGLANAPSFFQRTMNHILAPLLGKCVLVYIDDLVVYSPSKSQHLQDLEEVFSLLDQFNLKLKRSKCEFGKLRVELLGYQIDARGIAPLPDKTAAIRDLPRPGISEPRDHSWDWQITIGSVCLVMHTSPNRWLI